MTLLELTVVILVLLSLIALLFIGARGWKRGSDRAMCILHINALQKAVRGLANVNNLSPGDSLPGLESRLIGSGGYFEALPDCPGGGGYTTAGDDVPPIGELYMNCDLSVSLQHVPAEFAEW